jgi:hypothetical protein
MKALVAVAIEMPGEPREVYAARALAAYKNL